jgi:hypothetical protein
MEWASFVCAGEGTMSDTSRRARRLAAKGELPVFRGYDDGHDEGISLRVFFSLLWYNVVMMYT